MSATHVIVGFLAKNIFHQIKQKMHGTHILVTLVITCKARVFYAQSGTLLRTNASCKRSAAAVEIKDPRPCT